MSDLQAVLQLLNDSAQYTVLSVAIPAWASRVADHLGPNWESALADQATSSAGIAGRPRRQAKQQLARWLTDPETRIALFAIPTDESVHALQRSLGARLSDITLPDPSITATLVNYTVTYLLSFLKPEDGHTVAEYRAQERFDHLLLAIAGLREELDFALRRLPSSTNLTIGVIPRRPLAFIERDKLDQLGSKLATAFEPRVCTLFGPPGCGKTQLAGAYARSRCNEGFVVWISSDSTEAAISGLASFAERLHIADPNGDSTESARRLREHLEGSPEPGLIVLDNAVSPDVLRPFLPATGDTDLVITTTNLAFRNLGEIVELGGFSRQESVAYLTNRTGHQDVVNANIVADELADLPLALAQAAATISAQHLSYETYLTRLAHTPVERILTRREGDDYPRGTAAAILLSLDSVATGDGGDLAVRLLSIFSFLSPNGVRRKYVASWFTEHLHDDLTACDRALEKCFDGSVLTWSSDQESVQLHRLIGRVLRERMTVNEGQLDIVRDALLLLRGQLFSTSNAWELREDGNQVVDHLQVVWQHLILDEDGALMTRALPIGEWVISFLRKTDLNRAISLGEALLLTSLFHAAMGGSSRRALVTDGRREAVVVVV